MNQIELRGVFEDLVKEYEDTIYSVCYMYGENRPEVDDLFQESLINLWRGLPNFRGESNIKSWIYRISLNVCISYKRKKRINTVPLNISAELFDETSPKGKNNKLLHERIMKLKKFDRAIILLWLEDLSYEEIAAIVGISVKAVGVKLVRIKEKMKNL